MFVCHFQRDCSLGEDEMNCSSYKVCPENMFECSSHECIENQYFCDGSPGNVANHLIVLFSMLFSDFILIVFVLFLH